MSTPSSAKHIGAATEILIITGMSGAGRGTAAHRLEDLGWFVVENLPPQMLVPLAKLCVKGGTDMPKVAAVVDIRGSEHFHEPGGLREAFDTAKAAGINFRILFLDAADNVLVRRFDSVRRPHPLQGDRRILDGIQQEREELAEVRAMSDIVLDTSDNNVHELGARIMQVMGEDDDATVRLTIMSFGFKYGSPVDADHIADVRFIPNPYWVPELRSFNGTDKEVSDFVLSQQGASEFLDDYARALTHVVEGYIRENRPFATIAIGCTGGKHRSVASSIALAEKLSLDGATVRVSHRDLGRE